jgi:hypothetical protein
MRDGSKYIWGEKHTVDRWFKLAFLQCFFITTFYLIFRGVASLVFCILLYSIDIFKEAQYHTSVPIGYLSFSSGFRNAFFPAFDKVWV